MRLLLIGAFGAIGTLARYGLQGLVQIKMGSTFPYGTLLVNLTGCFFLGLIGQILLNRVIVPPEWRMAIAVGFFGGYTTFSSFAWETFQAIDEGSHWIGFANVALSVILGYLAVWCGTWLVRR